VGFIEAFLGPIISFFLSAVGGRPLPRIRVEARRDMLAFIGNEAVYSPHAYLYVHNSGRRPFTVNEAGWEASDGEATAASRGGILIQPGHPEESFTWDISELQEFAASHRGLRRPYVVLAGETKRRHGKKPDGWEDALQAAA
jgi:hypothetical protein